MLQLTPKSAETPYGTGYNRKSRFWKILTFGNSGKFLLLYGTVLEILNFSPKVHNTSFDYQTRALVQFSGTDFTEMSQSIHNGKITIVNVS